MPHPSLWERRDQSLHRQPSGPRMSLCPSAFSQTPDTDDMEGLPLWHSVLQTAVREALSWPVSDGCGVTRLNPAGSALRVPWSVVIFMQDLCHGSDADRRRFRNTYDPGLNADFRWLKLAGSKV
ncbi:hypothetical protein GC248_02725 [Acetobacter senegalensis]|nr:hypothetical protein [Acetobacter senegalensis]